MSAGAFGKSIRWKQRKRVLLPTRSVCAVTEPDLPVDEETTLVNDLQPALKQEQFILFFQPQFSLTTGAAIGAEALVRWNHPKAGFMMPGDFIPVFEKTGWIARLDYYVAEHACRIIGKWCKTGNILNPVSINLSRATLLNSELVDILLHLTEKYHVPVSLLNLEITESAWVSNPEQLTAAIYTLRRAGFMVIMDDFGSGYSSLNMLKDIDADALKLDMNFFSGGSLTKKGKIILTSVIQMAAKLGLPVIAEGVETQEQKDFLTSINCAYIQGYYYARPMPQKEYEKTYCRKTAQ